MTSLRQAFRAESDAAQNVARYLGIRDEARAVAGVALLVERQRQGLSYRELAKRVGCSPQTLFDIEHGRRWSDVYFHYACQALGCLPHGEEADDA